MSAAKKRSSGSNLPTRWHRFRSQPYIFWPSLFFGGLAIIVLFFFAAGANFGTFQDQLHEWGLARPSQRQKDGEILILITNFYTGNETRQSTIQEELKAAIEEQVTALELGHDIQVEIDPKIIAADDLTQARQIGEIRKATTVIWGTDTNAQMEVSFLDITRPDFESYEAVRLPSEKERPILAAPDEYVRFVTDGLSTQINFLALYAIGNSYLNTENYVQAENVIRYALDNFGNEVGPEFQTNVWFRLAFASDKSGNFEQAVANYTRVIDSDPRHVDAFTNRGSAYFSLGEYEKAIGDYDQAMAINPQSLLPIINRGSTFSDLGECQKALADFDRAIGLDSQFPVIFALRGSVYLNLGECGLAITDFDQALALDPQFGFAFYSRANVYARLGEPERAISDFSQVIILDPQFAFAYYRRGTVYDSLGEYEKAIEDFNQAIALDPHNKDFYLDRGGVYGNIGEHEKAIADFAQAIAIEPQYVVAYYSF